MPDTEETEGATAVLDQAHIGGIPGAFGAITAGAEHGGAPVVVGEDPDATSPSWARLDRHGGRQRRRRSRHLYPGGPELPG